MADPMRRDDDGNIIAVRLRDEDGNPLTLTDARDNARGSEWEQFEAFAADVAGDDGDD